MLRVTLTAVKADIGSIGGHIRPSVSLLDEVEKSLKPHLGKDIIDFRLSFTGDAVSYTHLDVYKRQLYLFESFAKFFALNAGICN